MGRDELHILKVYEFVIICFYVKIDELTIDAEEKKKKRMVMALEIVSYYE